jgi:Zinc knuckle
MAFSAQTRSQSVKKPTGSENKSPAVTFTPNRQLARTPPPTVNGPIAGTPITRPSVISAPPKTTPALTNSDISPQLQPTTETTSVDSAIEILKAALSHMNGPYDHAKKKIKQGQDPHKTTIETPYHVYEEIGNKIAEALTHLTQYKAPPAQMEEQLARLELSLKEAITTATTRRPYAHVVTTTATATATATPTPDPDRVREIQRQNRERKEQQRREQAKFEVTLTTQEPDTKEQLAQLSHTEITTKLQQTIESQMKDNCLTIHGIQKLKSKDIRLHCNTEKEAEQLRKLEWDKFYNGLKVHQPKFGIVINGVPTTSMKSNELQNPELTKELELQNKGSGLQIVGMKTLRRKPKDNAQHFSLVMFVTSADTANECIKHGIYIHQQRFPAEKYDPNLQLIQCYKCQQLGHHASKCRSLHEVCGKCSEHHPTSQCHSETHKCAVCKEGHPAFHEDCPHKISARQKLISRRREAPTYYTQ